MRQIISTGLVALVVGALAGATVGALAQDEPATTTERAISPSAVSSINAHKVDGRHAVGSGASKTKRARKLVATNSSGYLPSNIVKPKWNLISGKPTVVTGIQVSLVINNQTISAGVSSSVSAACPAGSKVIGGGFSQSAYDVRITDSRPSGNSWVVYAESDASNARTIYGYATCMTTTPGGAISSAGTRVRPAAKK